MRKAIRNLVPVLAVAAFVSATAPAAMAQEDEPMPPCRATEAGRALDFWIGEWTVTDGGDTVLGASRVEWDADGCAVHEYWQGAQGARGTSLFYFAVNEDTWHQVWVTGNTALPWGLKFKDMIARGEDGSVQFQSEQVNQDGVPYLDRTTLTPNEGGTVRQLIEISTDDGATWRTSFDAIYERGGEAN